MGNTEHLATRVKGREMRVAAPAPPRPALPRLPAPRPVQAGRGGAGRAAVLQRPGRPVITSHYLDYLQLPGTAH